MTETPTAVLEVLEKPWWQSRAIIGSLVTVAASMVGIAGYTLNVPLATELAVSIATLVGGALSWYGRIKADRLISRTAILPKVRIGE